MNIQIRGNIQKEDEARLLERVNLEIAEYEKDNPYAKYKVSDIWLTTNYQNDFLETTQEFGFESSSHSKESTNTAASILFRKMGYPARIIVSVNYNKLGLYEEQAVYHELIHAGDYYDYSSRNDFFDTTWDVFSNHKKHPNYYCVLVATEFRAYYISALRHPSKIPTLDSQETFYERQSVAVKVNNDEKLDIYDYLYYAAMRAAYYWVYKDKQALDEIFRLDKEHPSVKQLVFFFGTLRNQSFLDIENNFSKLKQIISNLCAFAINGKPQIKEFIKNYRKN